LLGGEARTWLPVFHHLGERVRAHVLICMLACYLTWHLRRAWAPLTFTDEDPPVPANPVAPARRLAWAQAKASYQYDRAGQPYRSFHGLLQHLCVPKTSSTSCDQAVLVDQASGAGLPSDAVPVEIDRFG
jgi:hypothetical protein